MLISMRNCLVRQNDKENGFDFKLTHDTFYKFGETEIGYRTAGVLQIDPEVLRLPLGGPSHHNLAC